jgi:hypothetical protein
MGKAKNDPGAARSEVSASLSKHLCVNSQSSMLTVNETVLDTVWKSIYLPI